MYRMSHLQYPLCLSLLERKRVDVMPMITHRFGFSEAGVKDGFDTAARSAETKAIKVRIYLQNVRVAWLSASTPRRAPHRHRP